MTTITNFLQLEVERNQVHNSVDIYFNSMRKIMLSQILPVINTSEPPSGAIPPRFGVFDSTSNTEALTLPPIIGIQAEVFQPIQPVSVLQKIPVPDLPVSDLSVQKSRDVKLQALLKVAQLDAQLQQTNSIEFLPPQQPIFPPPTVSGIKRSFNSIGSR